MTSRPYDADQNVRNAMTGFGSWRTPPVLTSFPRMWKQHGPYPGCIQQMDAYARMSTPSRLIELYSSIVGHVLASPAVIETCYLHCHDVKRGPTLLRTTFIYLCATYLLPPTCPDGSSHDTKPAYLALPDIRFRRQLMLVATKLAVEAC